METSKAQAARDAGRAKRDNGRSGSIQVRLPADLKARLDQAAEDRVLGTNLLIVKGLEDYLSRLIPVEELELTRSDGYVPDEPTPGNTMADLQARYQPDYTEGGTR